ncbi:protein rrp5 [Anaeramoeba flamelloides]|uniref:Protein rrp5 n=1 Tax=Anaeramoeba flamelloides TaxID=1746091 RepID=A0AAV8A2H3_9EUKA|nr:protein rrp5 [Anaeramoeba flamelloides]
MLNQTKFSKTRKRSEPLESEFNEIYQKNKRKKKNTRTKKQKIINQPNLTTKVIESGILILGIIRSVGRDHLIVSLPGCLGGYISAQNLSDHFPKENQEEKETETNNKQEKETHIESELKKRYKPGQQIICKYIEGPVERNKNYINLSISPKYIHSGMEMNQLKKNCLLWCSVAKQTKKGFHLTFVKEQKNNKRYYGFLSNNSVPSFMSKLNIGQCLLCSIRKFQPNNERVSVKLAPKLNTIKIKDKISPKLLLPGQYVNVIINQIKDDHMVGQLFKNKKLTCIISSFHLQLNKIRVSKDQGLHKMYRINSKIRARIVCISHTAPFNVYLSLNPPLDSQAITNPTAFLKNMKKIQISKSLCLLDTTEGKIVKIFSKKTNLRLPTEFGFIGKHLLESNGYNSNSKLTILDYNFVDNLFVLSLANVEKKQKAIQAKNPKQKDFIIGQDRKLKVGEKVQAKVIGFQKNELEVQVGNKTGIIPKIHISDKVPRRIEGMFSLGTIFSCRILSIGALSKKAGKGGPSAKNTRKSGEGNRQRSVDERENDSKIILTHKETLMNSPYPSIISLRNLILNQLSHGVIVSIKNKSLVVGFYGGITGTVVEKEIPENLLQNFKKEFFIGKIVLARIIFINQKHSRLFLSLKTNDFEYKNKILSKKEIEKRKNSPLKKYSIGSIVSGRITKIESFGITGKIINQKRYKDDDYENEDVNDNNDDNEKDDDDDDDDDDGITWFLPYSQISDHLSNRKQILKCLKVNHVIKSLLIMNKNYDKNSLAVSRRPIFLNTVLIPNIGYALPKSNDDFKLGRVYCGFIQKITTNYISIGFSKGFYYVIFKEQLLDSKISSIKKNYQLNMTVFVKVVRKEDNKFLLSLKYSHCHNENTESQFITSCFIDQLFIKDQSPKQNLLQDNRKDSKIKDRRGDKKKNKNNSNDNIDQIKNSRFLNLGQIVSCKVTNIKKKLIEVKIHDYQEKFSGVIYNHHLMKKDNLKTGSKIQALVLNININTMLIELSNKEQLLTEKKRIDEEKKNLEIENLKIQTEENQNLEIKNKKKNNKKTKKKNQTNFKTKKQLQMRKFKDNEAILGKIELIKNDYLVVSFKSKHSFLGCVSTKQINSSRKVNDHYQDLTVGKEIYLRYINNEHIFEKYNFDVMFDHTNQKLFSIIHNTLIPRDFKLPNITLIITGNVETGIIKKITDTNMEVSLSNQHQGRIHITQVWDTIKNGELPFDNYKVGQKINVKILGKYHQRVKDKITNVIELSIKPSELIKKKIKSKKRTTNLHIKSIKPGKNYICFCSIIKNEKIILHVTPCVTGEMRASQISNNEDFVNNPIKYLKYLQPMKCRVKKKDDSMAILSYIQDRKNKFKLVEVDEKERIPLHNPNDTPDNLPKNGSIVIGKITSFAPNLGIRVKVKEFYGMALLVDLTDTLFDYPLGELDKNDEKERKARGRGRGRGKSKKQQRRKGPIIQPKVRFRVGGYYPFYVLGYNEERQQLQLSLKDSLLKNRDMVVEPKDLPITRQENPNFSLMVGDIVEGYVTGSKLKEIFLQISRNISGVISLKNEFNEQYRYNLTKIFRSGKLLKCKVIQTSHGLNESSTVQLKLIESDQKIKLEYLQKDQVYKGEIVNILDKGMFINLQNSNLIGFVHNREIFEKQKDYKDLNKIYKEKQIVECVIIDVNHRYEEFYISLKKSKINKIKEMNNGNQEGNDKKMVVEHQGDNEKENQLKILEILNKNKKENTTKQEMNEEEMNEEKLDEEKLDKEKMDEEEIDKEDKNGNKMLIEDNAKEKTSSKISLLKNSDEQLTKLEKNLNSYLIKSFRNTLLDNKEGVANKKNNKKRIRKLKTIKQYEKILKNKIAEGNIRNWFDYIKVLQNNNQIKICKNILERMTSNKGFKNIETKTKIWIKYLKFEIKNGNLQTIIQLFRKSINANSQNKKILKQIFIKFIEILEKNEKITFKKQIFQKFKKQFGKSVYFWIEYSIYAIQSSNLKGIKIARKILQRGMSFLPEKKHLKLLIRFALLEFHFGNPENGRKMFESILTNYPNKIEIWWVYISTEIGKQFIQQAQQLFERALEMQVSELNIKILLSQYLKFEKGCKNEEQEREKRIEHVNQLIDTYLS